MNKRKTYFIALFLLAGMSAALLWGRGRKEDYPDPNDNSQMRISDIVPVDPELTKGSFDNGLTYYIRHNETPENRLVLRLGVNAGSVLENENQRGLAHFVEHMAFNGTENFEKNEIIDYLEGIGIQFGPDINAYTSFDETVYKLTLPADDPEVVERGFQILSDWAFRISFDEEEIDKERGVVLEEWRLGRGAGARMREEYFPVLFAGSRYAHRLPIGKKEIIEGFEYGTLIKFYEDWYRPDLMSVVAVGDYPEDELLGLTRKYFAGVGLEENRRRRPVYRVPDHEDSIYTVVTDPETTNTLVRLLFKHDADTGGRVVDQRNRMIRAMYIRMLNQRFDELTKRPDPPFIYGAADHSDLVRTKAAFELAAVVPEGGVIEGLKALMIEAKRVREHGFTPGELDRVRKEFLGFYKRAYEERDKTESYSYAGEYLRNFFTGEVIPGIEYEYELFRRYAPEITLGEVNRLGEDLITEDNRMLLVTGPESGKETMPEPEELAVLRMEVEDEAVEPYVDITADTEFFTETPVPGNVIAEAYEEEYGITELSLSNGVKVFLKPTDFKNREILLSAYSPGGVSAVSDENYVSAMLLPSIISVSGVGDFSATELQKLLAGKQVSLNPSVSNIVEGFSGSATPEDLETLLQLVYLYMTSPRKDRDAYTSLQSRYQALVANRSRQPEAVYSDRMQELISQGHYRRRPLSSELLNEMDLDAAYRVYNDMFTDAGDFTFFLAGNFQPELIKPLLNKYIGSLPSSGGGEHWRDEGVRFPSGIVKENIYAGIEPKSRVSVVFGGPLEWSYKRDHLFDSLIRVLDITLRELMREEISGTYDVGVSGDFGPFPGEDYRLQIYFGCEPERAEELTGVLFDELKRTAAEAPSEDVIEKVREQQRTAFEDALEENRFWLSVMQEADLLDLSYDTVLDIDTLINEVTPENVRQTAAEVLDLDRYVLGTLYPENMRESEAEGK